MSKLIFSKTLSHNGNMQMSMNNCEIVFSKMSTVPDVNSRFGQRQFSLISVDHIRLRYQFNPSNFWHMRHTIATVEMKKGNEKEEIDQVSQILR